MSDNMPAHDDAVPADDDAARWRAAKQLRQDYPGWIVIWIARTGQYRAYPRFRAPRGTAPTAQTPEQLAVQIEQVEQSTRRPRSRSQQSGGDSPNPGH
jgi:hypothetical protein